MIIITLKNGIVGVERIATDEEIILKDYDHPAMAWPNESISCDDDGYYLKAEL